MVYLRYNDQIKSIITKKEQTQNDFFDTPEKLNEHLFDGLNTIPQENSFDIHYQNNKTSLDKEIEGNRNELEKDLEKISEKSHEKEACSVEEYHVYYHNNSSDGSIFNAKRHKDSIKLNEFSSFQQKAKTKYTSECEVKSKNKENESIGIENKEVLSPDSERTFKNEKRESKDFLSLQHENKLSQLPMKLC